jgi:uncharacterized membrane protein
MGKFLQTLFLLLFAVFCLAYPIAVTGIAFDVRPSFSLSWAGSALLLLEGTLLIVGTMLLYGELRGLCAGLTVMVISYLLEAIGVQSGFPFGAYRYTDVLFPQLPGSVPLAVLFAWVLIIFSVYSWLRLEKQRLTIGRVLIGALLATLLDMEIEPVATHLEHYWEWLAPGHVNYYGVPIMNFVAWFVVAWVLLFLIDRILPNMAEGPTRLVTLVPRLLFGLSLFMFGLVDLTHGYYGAVVPGILASALLLYRYRRPFHTIPVLP